MGSKMNAASYNKLFVANLKTTNAVIINNDSR